MKTQSTKTIHDTVEGLLPWYVNGTLSADERNYVEEHLSGCDSHQVAIRELRQIAAAVQEETPTPLVTEPDVERLNALLDADASTRSRRTPLYLAAAALTAALFAGLLALGDFSDRQAAPAVFETATAPDAGTLTDYVVRIEFAANVAADERQSILKSIGVRDAAELSGSTAVRGVVSLPAASVAELEAVTGGIEARNEIVAVEVLAVQLPVHTER